MKIPSPEQRRASQRWYGLRLVVGGALLSLCASTALAQTTQACDVSAADRSWIAASLDAWRFSAREISGTAADAEFEALFFDEDCVLRSVNAFQHTAATEVQWTTAAHAGEIGLPDGQAMPAGVTSFASTADGHAFFVMATPSVWRAADVSNEGIGLENMMTAVLLHESAHVSQAATYGERITALVQANSLSDDFNDDSIQQQFGNNADFAAGVQREIDLLFESAAAPDIATARSLAQQARSLMQARRTQWFAGDAAYLTEAEDLWLSLEGSGQWLAYQWLIQAGGGGFEPAVAMPHFGRRGRWWSQLEGIALALALDRLAGNEWRQAVYGGGQTLTKLLDQEL